MILLVLGGTFHCCFMYIPACEIAVLNFRSVMLILVTGIFHKPSSLFLMPCKLAWSSLTTYVFLLRMISQPSSYSFTREIRGEVLSSGSTIAILFVFEILLEIECLSCSVAKMSFVFDRVTAGP